MAQSALIVHRAIRLIDQNGSLRQPIVAASARVSDTVEIGFKNARVL